MIHSPFVLSVSMEFARGVRILRQPYASDGIGDAPPLHPPAPGDLGEHDCAGEPIPGYTQNLLPGFRRDTRWRALTVVMAKPIYIRYLHPPERPDSLRFSSGTVAISKDEPNDQTSFRCTNTYIYPGEAPTYALNGQNRGIRCNNGKKKRPRDLGYPSRPAQPSPDQTRITPHAERCYEPHPTLQKRQNAVLTDAKVITLKVHRHVRLRDLLKPPAA